MSREPVALIFATLLVVASFSQAPVAQASGTNFRFEQGDTICLLGGGLAERMQHHGWLETRLQARFPDLGLTFRNLGFAADELTIQQRTSGFGSWDEHLSRIGADVIFAFFGFNASFAGNQGLARFRDDLAAFISHARAQSYNGEDAPRLVLFSPLPFEQTGDPLLPSPEHFNRRLAEYSQVMSEVAAAHGVPFVDLFEAMIQWRKSVGFASEPNLTINGAHLHERGNELAAGMIERLLVGEAPASETPTAVMTKTRALVLEKNLLWFNRYRATDGYNVYGGRSSLTYDGVTNFEVLQRELVVIDAMVGNLDRAIHASARGRSSPEPLPVPEQIAVKTNRPGPLSGGAYSFQSGEQALASMTPAPGMQVELFADEARFPELVNPVQMAFDTRGRMWVAVWPTYPHWAPGQPMNDALLILEDTDGDGKADTCEPFVDDLHNPTGFEFWNGGVFVANAPDLLFLKDTDGDGRADLRERVVSGLSSGDTHHAANSFVLGPGGALYFQEGTFHQTQIETIYGPVRNNNGCVWRFEPRTWRVQRYVPYNFANPHGHVFDRWGQDFVTDGTGNVNYYALPFSGYVEPGRKHGGYFSFFPQRSRPCAATEILSSGHFPATNQGNYLVANVIGFQGIFQYEVHDDGSGFAATEVDPIVFSSDPNFRPADLEVGPDGALYFLDWQNPLIGHMQHHLRDPSRDGVHGRVYRVSMAGRDALVPVPIAGQPVDALLELLHSEDDRVRYRVRIELSGRESSQVVSAARRWAAMPDVQGDEHALLEALWVQQQHGVLDNRLLERVLQSPDFRARAAATRVLRWMHRQALRPLDLLEASVADEHPRVRLEALVALSEFEDARAAELALSVMSRPTDRFLDYALKETLATLAPYWREALGSGVPFSARDPNGLAYALSRLDSEALAGVYPSAPLYNEVLSRHGLGLPAYRQAVEGLAEMSGSAPVHELLTAIERADARSDGHADHLLIGLFDVLSGMPDAVFRSLGDTLTDLSRAGRRASTRRLATAARLRADGSAEPSWSEACRSLASLKALLDAAPMVRDEVIAQQLFPKVAALLDGLPAGLAGQDSEEGVVGKSVRIELPGEARTLTLAEVQVFSRGQNIAPRGTASQSTTNWSGVAERAIDGNTSGVYAQNGQSHTREDEADTWWQLDLPGLEPLDSIVVWNRTEAAGRWVSRLDGFVVTVLDESGRTVFRSPPQAAPEESGTLQLTAPALAVRRAAVRCLGELGVSQRQAVSTLLSAFDEDDLRATAVDALHAISIDAWSESDVDGAGRRLQRLFGQRPSEEFESLTGRRMLALADHVGQRLGGSLGQELSRLRRGLGPQIVVIRPVRDSLTYDVQQFTVQAGRPIELLFDNTDIMPHNLLVAAPGSLARVGMAGEAMAAEADAWERAFVPSLSEVLAATGLLQPGERELLIFDAPDDAGDYPYLCTFPGHWVRMNGVMTVVDELPEEGPLIVSSLSQAHADGGGLHDHAESAPARTFVKLWTLAEFSTDLGAIDDADPVLGRSILEQASCLRCHRIGDEPGGALTGPPLAEAVTRHDRAGLLTSLLDPSALISEGYEAETLFLADGTVTAGRLLAQDDHGVTIQADPYDPTATVVSHAAIAERRVSTISTMPEGLLMTFEREEILALIAYLESLQQ